MKNGLIAIGLTVPSVCDSALGNSAPSEGIFVKSAMEYDRLVGRKKDSPVTRADLGVIFDFLPAPIGP